MTTKRKPKLSPVLPQTPPASEAARTFADTVNQAHDRDWTETRLPAGLQTKLADIDRALSGLDGVLAILAANNAAAEVAAAEAEPAVIGPLVAAQLHHAAQALTASAHAALMDFGDAADRLRSASPIMVAPERFAQGDGK